MGSLLDRFFSESLDTEFFANIDLSARGNLFEIRERFKRRAEDIFNAEWESLEAVMDRLDICFGEAVELLEDVLMPEKVSRYYQKILKKSDEIGGRAAIASYLLLRTLTKAYGGNSWQLGYIRQDTLQDLCLAHYNRDYEKVISGCEGFEEDFQQMRENYDEMLRNGSL